MTRIFLRGLTRLLIGSLLSMQIALAAHVCTVGLLMPKVQGDRQQAVVAAVIAADREAQPCVAGTDDASDGICGEHCKRGQQSDQAGSLVVPVGWLIARYVVEPPADPAPLGHQGTGVRSVITGGDPPHAILHCVLRT